MTDKITEKSTKATILSAYKEAQREIRKLKAAKPAQSSEVVKVEPYEPKTASEIASGIQKLKANFSYALNELEDQTIAKMDTLTRIEGEIKSREDVLEECHEITREADTLAALQHANKEERENQQVFLSERKAGFDEEMQEKRKKWQREAEEYEYKTNKERQREREEAERAKEELERSIEERQKEFERSIHERLIKLDEREAICDKIEEEMEGIKERHADQISEEVQRAISYTEASSKHEYETETRLLSQKVDSLEGTIADLKEENKQLKTELKNINKMANEVAQQAVQSNKVVHISEKQA